MAYAALITHGLAQYGYIALFPILFLGGPAAALGAGFLASQGYFWPFFIWPLAIAADLTSDIVWYTLGRFGRGRIYHRLKTFFSAGDAAIAKADHLFHRYGNKIIFFSKATMGFGLFAQFMLILQGFLRIPFRVFLLYNFLAGIILSGAATFSGYYFGRALTHISFEMRIIIFLGSIIGIVLAGKTVRRFMPFFRMRQSQ